MARAKKTLHYSVGRTEKNEVFRDIKTGSSVSRIMNKRVYEEATARAGEKMRQYVGDNKRS